MPRDPVYIYRPAASSSRGRLEVNPAFAPGFAALGIDSPAGFIDLPGEVVSGHPDRHVLRVELPGFPAAFYLKRQHAVTRRERLRNWLAGFGWVSRCEREAELLKHFALIGLPGPLWAAVGTDDHGRAFLLVEEVRGACDLRQVLGDTPLSHVERSRFAERIGRLVALFHATGFTTPDLTAKHVFVSPDGGGVTLIDWQAALRVRIVPTAERIRCLAALHASVANNLASARDRLRVLWAALRPARMAGLVPGRFSDLARRVVSEGDRLADRRSLCDQRQPIAANQRLVWVAGEAVCAIPDVAASWPTPPLAAPFYGGEPGAFAIRLPNGSDALLIRGRSITPFGRLSSWLRGRPWRSPGVTVGRLLFHLERYGVPAPRLLAFGQRLTGMISAEWFALHTPPVDAILVVTDAIAEQLGRCLRQLHNAGCRPTSDTFAVFGADGAGVRVRDITAIRLVRRVTKRDRAEDLRDLLASLDSAQRTSAEAGYQTGENEQHPVNRAIPTSVSR